MDKETFTKANIYHALINEENFENCIYKTDLPSLDVCPSNNDLVGAELELVHMFARESKLKVALEAIQDKYDYIIIDCAPSLNLLTVNAFTAAHTYLVPMQTEYLAMEGLSQLLNTVRLIRASLNPKLSLEGILLTMYDSRNNLCKLVANDLMTHFKDDIFKSIIPIFDSSIRSKDSNKASITVFPVTITLLLMFSNSKFFFAVIVGAK